MTLKRVFVTVGTTKFDKLLHTVLNKHILDILYKLGYKEIQIQTGIGDFHYVTDERFNLKFHKFFDNFSEVISKSDLVISHAGAGTCLEVLHLEKPLICVVNEDLMDNHQIELAQQLQKDGYLYYCTCETLEETLEKDLTNLKKYRKPDPKLFSDYLDKCIGFK